VSSSQLRQPQTGVWLRQTTGLVTRLSASFSSLIDFPAKNSTKPAALASSLRSSPAPRAPITQYPAYLIAYLVSSTIPLFHYLHRTTSKKERFDTTSTIPLSHYPTIPPPINERNPSLATLPCNAFLEGWEIASPVPEDSSGLSRLVCSLGYVQE